MDRWLLSGDSRVFGLHVSRSGASVYSDAVLDKRSDDLVRVGAGLQRLLRLKMDRLSEKCPTVFLAVRRWNDGLRRDGRCGYSGAFIRGASMEKAERKIDDCLWVRIGNDHCGEVADTVGNFEDTGYPNLGVV